jgi:hypothetical protein
MLPDWKIILKYFSQVNPVFVIDTDDKVENGGTRISNGHATSAIDLHPDEVSW